MIGVGICLTQIAMRGLGGNTLPDMQITQSIATAVAPFAVALSTNFDRAGVPWPINIAAGRYIWTVTHETEAAPEFRNLPENWPWGKSAWVSSSPNPHFYLPFAGTYTITCAYYYDGQVRTGSTTVTLTAGSFSGVELRYVDPDGDFSGVPAGASTYTTISAALSDGNLRNKIVHLRRGKVFPASAQINCRPGAGFRVEIRDFGDPLAARPRVEFQASGIAFNTAFASATTGAGDILFRGIHISSTWDPSTETFNGATSSYPYPPETIGQISPVGVLVGNTTAPDRVVMHDVEFSGLGICARADGRPLILNDCLLTNWQTYAWYVSQGDRSDPQARVAIFGGTHEQDPDGLGGGTGKELYGWRHGVGRYTEGVRHSVEMVSAFSNAGWTTNADLLSNQRPAHQGFIRANSLGQEASEIYIGHCIAEGGTNVINLMASGGTDANNAGGGQLPGCYLVDSCILVGTSNTRNIMQLGFPGSRVINSVFILPNTPHEYLSGPSAWFSPGDRTLSSFVGQGSMAAGQVVDYCAFVDLRSDANGPADPMTVWDDAYAAEGYQNYIDRNCVFFSPNTTGADNSDGPFDLTEIFAAKYQGLRHRQIDALGAQAIDTAYATPAGTISLYAAEVGSGAATGETGNPKIRPLHDLLGEERIEGQRGPLAVA